MREKGFLGRPAIARDLVTRKPSTPALVAVDPTTLVRDALAQLRHYGISAAPVLSGDQNMGSVWEDDLLRRTLEDETLMERTVTSALQPAFGEVPAEDPVPHLLRRLKEEPILLVRDSATGLPIGVLTRHDLVAHLSDEAEVSDAV
jgi:predicted transcriptional regulator